VPLPVDMHLADETALQAVTRDVLTPQVASEALDLAVRDLEQPGPGTARVDTSTAELRRLEGELRRYARSPGAAPRHNPRGAEVARYPSAPHRRARGVADPGRRRPSRVLEYLDNWRDMARQGAAEARRRLRTVVVGACLHAGAATARSLPHLKGTLVASRNGSLNDERARAEQEKKAEEALFLNELRTEHCGRRAEEGGRNQESRGYMEGPT
jgi:hypothetical protein